MVVTRDALEKWLSIDVTESFVSKARCIASNDGSASDGDSTPSRVLTSGHVCVHGYLDPQKANEMKCISLVRPIFQILRTITITHMVLRYFRQLIPKSRLKLKY